MKPSKDHQPTQKNQGISSGMVPKNDGVEPISSHHRAEGTFKVFSSQRRDFLEVSWPRLGNESAEGPGSALVWELRPPHTKKHSQQ